MTTTGQLALWQEGLLLGLAAISLLYVFYFRIWLALAVGSDLLFASAFVLTIASITYPPPFESAANALVVRSPLPQALSAADAKVVELQAMPRDLFRSALAKLGLEDEEEPIGLEPPVNSPGPFVSAVRPSVDALVATSLRMTSFFCGSFLMLTSLAMRSSTTTARRLHAVSERIEALEHALRERTPAELEVHAAETRVQP